MSVKEHACFSPHELPRCGQKETSLGLQWEASLCLSTGTHDACDCNVLHECCCKLVVSHHGQTVVSRRRENSFQSTMTQNVSCMPGRIKSRCRSRGRMQGALSSTWTSTPFGNAPANKTDKHCDWLLPTLRPVPNTVPVRTLGIPAARIRHTSDD